MVTAHVDGLTNLGSFSPVIVVQVDIGLLPVHWDSFSDNVVVVDVDIELPHIHWDSFSHNVVVVRVDIGFLLIQLFTRCRGLFVSFTFWQYLKPYQTGTFL